MSLWVPDSGGRFVQSGGTRTRSDLDRIYRELKVERIYLRNDGENICAQYAIAEVLAPPVGCHVSVPVDQSWNDEDLEAYLIRCSQTMIQLYGDARENRLDPDFETSAAA